MWSGCVHIVVFAQPQAPATTCPNALRGRVVESGRIETGVGRAIVTVARGTPTIRESVISNDQGQFEFCGLPEGNYSVHAKKAAFISQSFGAQRPGGLGRMVTLPLDRPGDLVIELTRGGVISGVVSDHAGRHVLGLAVRAARIAGGRPVWVGATLTTDDRGEYRFFGLLPGRYVVMALPPVGEGTSFLADIESGRRKAFAPTFAPGTPTPAHARVLDLGANQQVLDANIVWEAVALTDVRGTVLRADGGPAGGVQVRSSATDSGFPGVIPAGLPATTNAAGEFLLRDVLPVPQRIEVLAREAGQVTWASAAVDPSGQSIEGLVLLLKPSLTVAGRITCAGDCVLDYSVAKFTRVVLEPASEQSATVRSTSTMLGNISPTGEFLISGLLPGRYRVSLGTTQGSNAWLLDSGRLDQTDVLAGGLVLEDKNIESLRLAVAPTPAEVTGRVVAPASVAPHLFQVVLLPSESPEATHRRPKAAPVAPDGTYVLQGLQSGSYLLALVPTLFEMSFDDENLMLELRSKSVPVNLQPGQKLKFDIALS